jgi:hypothetical protein
MDKLLYWSPRIVAIAGILFISAFALDAFDEALPLQANLVALFMHLLPSVALIFILVIAWRYELLGGILFLVVGILPFFLLSGLLISHLIVGGPFLVAGTLFLVSHRYRSR